MRKIVVMPGGFHPFHAGHYALYQSALKAFPDADVYVAATDDTKVRLFPFEIKEKLAKVAGVKPGRFVRVKSPFKAEEITRNYNPNEDVLIFVRSEKDRNESPKPGGMKKDGTPSYFQPYTGKDLQPFSKHAYFAYLPTVTFGPGIKSATEIRNSWPNLNDRQKMAMVMSLYPVTQKNSKLAETVVKLLNIGMSGELSEASSPAQQAAIAISKKEQSGIKENSSNTEILDPETEKVLSYAKQHYPHSKSKQDAFVIYVLRALRHSEEDDLDQDQKIENLSKEVARLRSEIGSLNEDYMDEV